MGWASGSELAEDVWDIVRPFIPEGICRAKVARRIIEAFESYDCDTIDEADDLCRDARRKRFGGFEGTWEEFEALPEYEDLEPC